MSNDNKVQKIGRYEVQQRIGAGGQGTVFRAYDPDLDRPVAIKLIHNDRAINAGPPQEGRLLARLRHPNIVAVYETGVLGSMPYFVFEYVEGVTLKAYIKHQQDSGLEAVCALMLQILDGVAHAHERRIVHLDLTPGNILVDREHVPRIMDFGLARYATHARHSGGQTIGSLRYMSPEHFNRCELGTHTDVFALSLIFFELLTGRPALQGKSAPAIMQQLTKESLDLLSNADSRQLQPLKHLLRGGLERDPSARYADAGVLRAALSAFLKDAGVQVVGTEPHATVEYFLRRMQRKEDFPALSRSLADINRLTSADSNASHQQLANVILRDYALTKRLLQLANSAFYGGGGSREVSNVTQAIVLLGFEQIRMAANGLCYAKHLESQPDNAALKDAITRSFVCGLITRHLARQAKLQGVEEAFIAGMFRNIGEHLTLYYFREEHDDILRHMRDHGTTLPAATRRVLGITFAELGASVARAWEMPDAIVDVIEVSPDGDPVVTGEPRDGLRNLAVFVNGLIALPGTADPDALDGKLRELCTRFATAVPIDDDNAYRVLESALEKLQQFAPILGVQAARSNFCSELEQWLAWWRAGTQAEAVG